MTQNKVGSLMALFELKLLASLQQLSPLSPKAKAWGFTGHSYKKRATAAQHLMARETSIKAIATKHIAKSFIFMIISIRTRFAKFWQMGKYAMSLGLF